MEKVLINLSVPALEQQYDLFVPQDVPIKKVIEIVVNGICDLSNNRYQTSGIEMLMTDRYDLPLRPDHYLFEYGIRDGEVLYLI